MHYGAAGREPLNGLTAERFLPKHELSSSQNRIAQTWAVGLFNAPGKVTCIPPGILIKWFNSGLCFWRDVERSKQSRMD